MKELVVRVLDTPVLELALVYILGHIKMSSVEFKSKFNGLFEKSQRITVLEAIK